MSGYTEVAAAVIENPDGTFLLAQRPEGKAYPGYWEFPGGKIEAGEDARAALVRELEEELGIRATALTPWITRIHKYTHAHVRLHFLRVTAWEGEPRPLEDQAIAWQRIGATNVSPMLPANAPILAALALPAVMIVSDAEGLGIDAWIAKLTERALVEPVLVQVREKGMGWQPLQHMISRALARAGSVGARIVVNSDCGAFPQASGVHLTSKALMAATARPEGDLVGASAHDERELDQAAKIGVDYAVVGPVKATPSHAGVAPISWERFAALARERPMPIYAIGGLTRADLVEARRHGAHGVALRGAAFAQ
ncbi:Nudix family hydrolase [Usitatibacter palustris]|uniref:8-oxo-dGTP diphosphatase n=1 Tax=Usitatibacter palustris TaxID=2732487 RepID=A0A6M4H456_9PROT|nr:Nudix family hydrolase [Usitatibacter palustris]QJR13868.1 Thiamine-phosphate synthase [Usitatibacter palustris]